MRQTKTSKIEEKKKKCQNIPSKVEQRNGRIVSVGLENMRNNEAQQSPEIARFTMEGSVRKLENEGREATCQLIGTEMEGISDLS